MGMVSLYQLIGPRAIDETRSVVILEDGELPKDSYAFMEFYCDDGECDCRRVIFQVWRESKPGKIWAAITYGWETPEYYASWSRWARGADAEEMATATLEPLSPQTKLAPALLRLFKDVLQSDAAYVERLKRHYHEACPQRGVVRATRPKGKEWFKRKGRNR